MQIKQLIHDLSIYKQKNRSFKDQIGVLVEINNKQKLQIETLRNQVCNSYENLEQNEIQQGSCDSEGHFGIEKRTLTESSAKDLICYINTEASINNQDSPFAPDRGQHNFNQFTQYI